MIFVVMGVCGSGKTTVGEQLAEHLGYAFHDADHFHSPENKLKMNAGIPLTDEDRLPWLASLHHLLLENAQAGKGVVLACSALKEPFRQSLIEGITDAKFVYLKGSKEVIARRLEVRKDHYMNPGLLNSQFEALQEPTNAITVNVDQSPKAIVEDVIRVMDREKTVI